MTASYTLTETERRDLEDTLHRGTVKGRVRTRAQILLKSSEDWGIAAIAATFGVSVATVSHTRARFRDGGVALGLPARVQAKRRHALTGEDEALLIALTCRPVPDGHDHGTLRNRLIMWWQAFPLPPFMRS